MVLMSKLDIAKEQIAYLKFWLGVTVVIDISLFGWLFSAGVAAAPWHRVVGALLVVAMVSLVGWSIHRQIERRIESLEEL